ncbi:MCP four helix bundle domain-containing protein, partial [Hylemonella gracilis]
MPPFISNLSVAKRLGLGFALVLLLSLITIIISIARLSDVAESTREMVDVPVRTERLISDWYRNLYTGVRRTTAIAKSSDPSLVAYFAEEVAQASKASGEYQKTVETLLTKERDKKLFAEIGEQRKVYLSTRDAINELKKAGKLDEANRMLDEQFTPAAKLYTSKMEALMLNQREDIDTMAKEIEANYEASRMLLVALAVVSTVLSMVFAWLLSGSITRPLLQAGEVARAVAQGDLSVQIDNSRTDEVGQLLNSLKEMQGSLGRVVSQVRQGSESVATASAEIAQGNQ